jgi:hypothetical protein
MPKRGQLSIEGALYIEKEERGVNSLAFAI